MKSILLLLTLLLAVPAHGQITVKTDEFTGTTTMSGNPHLVIHDADHSASMMAVRIEGQTYILLSTWSDSWVHLNDDTGFAIHGTAKTRLTLKALKISTDTEYSGSTLMLTETVAFQLTTHTLNNPVRIRFGSVIYDVPEQVVTDVRSIGTRLR